MKITQLLLSSGRLLPTMEEVLQYLQMADLEDDSVRDQRYLLALEDQLEDVDPRLSGHILTRRVAVEVFDFMLEGAEGEEAERAKMRIGEVLPDVASLAVDAALYGAAALRLEPWYCDDCRAWRWRVAERPDPHLLEKAGGQVFLIEEDASGSIAARRKLTLEEGWLVATDGRRRAGGALRRVLIYEVLRRDMLLEWANFSRKLKGIIQGIYREGALDEERSAAERALREAVRHNYLLTSEAITFNFHRLVQESAGLNFERLLDKLDADIAIAILGQANTSELPDRGGSRAALQVLDMIRSDIHYSDMIRAERLMQQVVDMDYRRNVSRQGEVPWRFTWDWSEIEEGAREREARVIGEVLDAGVPLLADEVYGRLGFTRPEGVPDIIERQRGF